MSLSSSLSLRLQTPRLELIAATLPLVEAEIAGPARLADLLHAEVGSWPPPLNDANSLQWTFERLRQNPEAAGFFAWYVVLLQDQKRRLVGVAGLTGPPDQHGTIEIGYSIVEAFQKQGIGTEATRALIQWVFEHPAVHRVTAQTLPALGPSIKIMERCGMIFLGAGSDPRTICYGITREQFQK